MIDRSIAKCTGRKMPTSLTIRNARVVSMNPALPRPRRGAQMSELGVIECADVVIEGATIKSVRKKPMPKGVSASFIAGTPTSKLVESADEDGTIIDAGGRALVPGLIDCHTHTCWMGQRLDEWESKRAGVPYLKILERGGGIMATVRAVRLATQSQLAEGMLARANQMLRLGSTTIEIKSGYGLTTADELKMLRAVREAQAHFAGTLIPTALLGHAIDESQSGFVGRVVRETLPLVAQEFPGIAVDAFCEKGAWSVEQCVLLFTRAKELGLRCRVHCDQFNSLGMIATGLRLGLSSFDHLEATTKDDLALLAKSDAMGVMLPCCGFHMDNRYARGKQFIAAGGALAIASNYNPGSAPCGSMGMTMALTVRHLGLSPAQALCAATINPAHVLGLTDRGTIAPGQRADLLLLNTTDERSLAFEFGTSCVERVIAGGKAI